jgi:hypothetical protein
MKIPNLKPIDLKKRCGEGDTEGNAHPDIKANKHYLVKHSNNWYAGQFSWQWYGWSFDAGSYSIQLDDEDWKAIFEIETKGGRRVNTRGPSSRTSNW